MSEQLHAEQLRAREYLARKGTNASADDLRSQLRHAFESIEQMFAQVREEERARAPEDGKWSAHQVLDHLVLSHAPAVGQLAMLLRGDDPPGVAIPAHLQSSDADRKSWAELSAQLASTHRDFLHLLETARDDTSLEPKALVDLVVKVDSRPVQWQERLDWKAFAQGVRVHTLEHRSQLERVIAALR